MKNKSQLTLLFLFLSISAAFSQKEVADSLYLGFRKSRSDSARCYFATQLAAQYYRTNTDTAIAWAKKGIEFARKAKSSQLEATSLSTLGVCYYYQGDLEKTLDLYFQSLSIAEKGGHIKSASTTLGNIGLLYAERNENEKAVGYLRKSLDQKITIGDSLGIARNYANIGLVYTNLNLPDSAQIFFEKQVSLCERLGEPYGMSIGLNNLGQVCISKKQYQLAIHYFREAFSLKKKLDDKNGMSITLGNIAEVHLEQGKTAGAIAVLDSSYRFAQEARIFPQQLKPCQLLAQAYAQLGEYKKAYQYQMELTSIKDTLNRQEALDRAADLEAKYQNQQQKAQLAEKNLELERQDNQKRRILMSSVGLILLVGGSFQYLRHRQRLLAREAELSAQLEHAEAEKLREMNAVKSAFFANISHEFRTPLTLILSPLDQMINGSFQGDLQKYYRIMQRNGRRLLDLVNQLLDLSKLETGKLKLEASEGDLSGFVKAIAGAFESLSIRRQIDLRVSTPEEQLSTWFDRDKVEKILANLLSNAFKFTPEEGRIEVSLSLDQSAEHAMITVSDSGIGISPAQLPHLFERFYHTEPSDLQAGSGLGLGLTKELAELHGGHVRVESREGAGSVFTVTLAIGKSFFRDVEIAGTLSPLQPSGPAEFFVPPPKTWEKRQAHHLLPGAPEKPILLLVEDNADVRAYIREQLDAQYHIAEAENGNKGVSLAQELTPDLIITDVMMPEMDGTTLCRVLKSNDKTSHIPIVMLTARADQEDRLDGLETGADDYLVKPFDTRELQVRLANLLNQRRKLQELYSKSLSPFASSLTSAPNMDTAFLKRVREAIDANLDDEQFSVVELSQMVNMSRSQLHRKLSALTGLGPNEIIRNMRLERARHLLERNAGTASEIAFLCGFSSPGYFSKCFKDYFGFLPSELR